MAVGAKQQKITTFQGVLGFCRSEPDWLRPSWREAHKKNTPLCGVLSLIEVGTGFEPV